MTEEQGQLPFEEREELRRDEARWWINRGRARLGSRLIEARTPCPDCGTSSGVLTPVGGQSTVRCANCGRLLYNAPKTETGEKPRSVVTVRRQVKPSQQARILDRDHARCVLCGRGDIPLTIGHLLSVDDGFSLGASEADLADDANLAAMCEACNAGLGGRSVLPATYARIMLHLVRATERATTRRPPALQKTVSGRRRGPSPTTLAMSCSLLPSAYRLSGSEPISTIVGVLDYGGAWSAERGRCHRLVYDHEGKPTTCPERPVQSGWRTDYLGRWCVVDACARHAAELTHHPHAAPTAALNLEQSVYECFAVP